MMSGQSSKVGQSCLCVVTSGRDDHNIPINDIKEPGVGRGYVSLQ